jgi:hypothetical protein
MTKKPGRVICTSVRQDSWAEVGAADVEVN